MTEHDSITPEAAVTYSDYDKYFREFAWESGIASNTTIIVDMLTQTTTNIYPR